MWLGLLALSPLHAQRLQQAQQPQEVSKILGISVEGNALADPAAIIANSGLRVGDDITIPGDQISQAMRKLWSLRIFDDIQVAVDRKMGNGVYLVIRVKEFPGSNGRRSGAPTRSATTTSSRRSTWSGDRSSPPRRPTGSTGRSWTFTKKRATCWRPSPSPRPPRIRAGAASSSTSILWRGVRFRSKRSASKGIPPFRKTTCTVP